MLDSDKIKAYVKELTGKADDREKKSKNIESRYREIKLLETVSTDLSTTPHSEGELTIYDNHYGEQLGERETTILQRLLPMDSKLRKYYYVGIGVIVASIIYMLYVYMVYVDVLRHNIDVSEVSGSIQELNTAVISYVTTGDTSYIDKDSPYQNSLIELGDMIGKTGFPRENNLYSQKNEYGKTDTGYIVIQTQQISNESVSGVLYYTTVGTYDKTGKVVKVSTQTTYTGGGD